MTEEDAMDHAHAFQLAAGEAERIGRKTAEPVAQLNAGTFYTIAMGYLALAREIRGRDAEKSND